MLIHLGNANAFDTLGADEEGNPIRVPLPGERVTTFRIDEPLGMNDVVAVVLGGLPRLMDSSGSPWWVEIEPENVELKSALLTHFRLAPDTVRPAAWGDGSTTSKKAKE